MREQLGVVLTVARDRTLARIELAYLGFNMSEYATWMAILVYAYGLGGAGVAAIFAFVQLIPAGLVAPFAATVGDRFRRDRALLAGYLCQAAALGATAVALYADAPPVVTAVVAASASVSFTLTRPVQSVILPGITHAPSDLTAANAVSGLAENVGIFVGPLLGGILLVGEQPGLVFAAFAAVSLVGALLVARLPRDVQGGTQPSVGGARRILGESLGGFRALAGNRPALLITLVLSAATVVVGALDILFVATAIDLLGASESWAGFLYAAFGFGGVLGALASVVLIGRRRMTPALAASGGLFGLPISAIGALPTMLSAPLLFAVSGAGFGVTSVAGRTLLQRTTPESVLARVFGVLEGLAMFSLAIGSLITGALVAWFGVAWALVLEGLIVPAVLLLVWVRLGALDRDARPPDPEALSLLRRLPIFAPLSAPTIEHILAELTWLRVPPGEVVVREGDPGDRFYILAEGEVMVSIRGESVGARGAGEHFGEIALLRSVPRTATVTAMTPLRLIAIERERFLEAVTGHPQSRASAEAVADALLPKANPG
ncbi:MAG: MFS transporter [Chloroflexota bacterium]